MNSIVLDMESRLSLITDTKYGVSRQAEATAKPTHPIPSSPSFRHLSLIHI